MHNESLILDEVGQRDFDRYWQHIEGFVERRDEGGPLMFGFLIPILKTLGMLLMIDGIIDLFKEEK